MGDEENEYGFTLKYLSLRMFLEWEERALLFLAKWLPFILAAGVAGGIGAIIFRQLILLNYKFFFEILNNQFELPIILLPVIGALIIGPIIYKFAHEAWGHGVPEVMKALYAERGVIRARVPFVKILVSAITIGSGGSAGREGPICQIGSSTASIIGQLAKLKGRDLVILVCCGAAAGISGTFKAPIGGLLFALEVLLRRIRIPEVVLIAISSCIGYIVSALIEGDEPVFKVSHIIFGLNEVLLCIPLGVICGLAAFIWVRSLYGVEVLFEKFNIGRKWYSPVLGALVVGSIGMFYPQVLGLGYNVINSLFNGDLEHCCNLPLPLFLFLLFVLKLIASSFTIGSGGSGGVFSPSLFMGCMLGAAYGALLQYLLPNLVPSYQPFALVAMAAIFAGAAKAPLTSTIIVCEMCKNFSLLGPLLLTCVISYLTSGYGSIYSFKLEREVGREIKDKYWKIFFIK